MAMKLNKANKAVDQRGTITVSVYHAPTNRIIDVAYRGLEVKAVNPRSAARHISYTEGNPFDEYSINVGAKVLQLDLTTEQVLGNHTLLLADAGVTNDNGSEDQVM